MRLAILITVGQQQRIVLFIDAIDLDPAGKSDWLGASPGSGAGFRIQAKFVFNFRLVFDGLTLAGWHAEPRLLIGETDRRFDGVPSDQLGAAVKEYYRKRPGGAALLENKGVWEVKDGAIIGGQVPRT